MKRFIINLFIFFFCIFVLDIVFGKFCEYFQTHAKGIEFGAEWHMLKEAKEEILVFGSSRAAHHYVSNIISSSTLLSCYNCGLDGNGIILHYGRYQVLSQRYNPKILIYDIEQIFDLEKGDNMKYLDHLRPFSKDSRVEEYILTIYPLEFLMNKFNMYIYNTKFIQMVNECVHPVKSTNNGYKPLGGVMGKEPQENKKNIILVDSIKLHYLERLIQETQSSGTKLIFVCSPYYKSVSDPDFSSILQLCEKYGISFWDYHRNLEISYKKEYFQDQSHLNDKGAQLFTTILCRDLERVNINN